MTSNPLVIYLRGKECAIVFENDHLCRSMGFGLTRDQQRNLDVIKQKYLALEEIE